MAIEIKEAIKAYLNEKGIYKLGRKEQLIAVVESVAEIPFGEGRTVEETLITKKVGTCSGKHTVLHACLNELGFKCRQII